MDTSFENRIIMASNQLGYSAYIGSLAECTHLAFQNGYEIGDIDYQILEINDNVVIHSNKPLHYWLINNNGNIIGGIHKFNHDYKWIYFVYNQSTNLV